MCEADVLYSDVKFTRAKEKANETISSLVDTTYSEVKILKTEPYTESPANCSLGSQHAVSSRRSKVTPERAALLVLGALLAAAAVALGVTTFDNMRTKEKLKNMEDLKMKGDIENKNLTERLSKMNSVSTVPLTCPQPTAVNRNEPCAKCEEGWEQHGGGCYYFSANKSSWEASRDGCRVKGGDLVKIDSRGEQTFLEKLLRTKMLDPEDKFWIGLTDSEAENKWRWADGSPLDTRFSFWSPGEPDNWKGKHMEQPDGENCVRMGEKAGAHDLKCWFDRSCKDHHRSICEKTAGTGRLTHVSMCLVETISEGGAKTFL